MVRRTCRSRCTGSMRVIHRNEEHVEIEIHPATTTVHQTSPQLIAERPRIVALRLNSLLPPASAWRVLPARRSCWPCCRLQDSHCRASDCPMDAPRNGLCAPSIRPAHAWGQRQTACVLDDQSSCPRTAPHQLTAAEVRAITDSRPPSDHRDPRARASGGACPGEAIARSPEQTNRVRRQRW
jgi:hypothetical protein